jgi:hypothetical protein
MRNCKKKQEIILKNRERLKRKQRSAIDKLTHLKFNRFLFTIIPENKPRQRVGGGSIIG